VAIGKWPHLATELRDGVLCAPFGPEWVARLGGFYLEVADGADADGPVQPFVAWLREELRRDTGHAPALLGLAKPKAAATRKSVRNLA
jgi:hypothetical protein